MTSLMVPDGRPGAPKSLEITVSLSREDVLALCESIVEITEAFKQEQGYVDERTGVTPLNCDQSTIWNGIYLTLM